MGPEGQGLAQEFKRLPFGRVPGLASVGDGEDLLVVYGTGVSSCRFSAL